MNQSSQDEDDEISKKEFEMRALSALEHIRLREKWHGSIKSIFGDNVPYRVDWKGTEAIYNVLSHFLDNERVVLQFPNQKQVQFGNIKVVDNLIVLLFSKYQLAKHFSARQHEVYFAQCRKLTFFSPCESIARACFLLETKEVSVQGDTVNYLDIFENGQYMPEKGFSKTVLGKGVVALILHDDVQSMSSRGYSIQEELYKNREGLDIGKTVEMIAEAYLHEW